MFVILSFFSRCGRPAVPSSLSLISQIDNRRVGLVQGMVFRPGEAKLHLWTTAGIRIVDGNGQIAWGYSDRIQGIFYSQDGKTEVILIARHPNEILLNNRWVKAPHVAEPKTGSMSPDGDFLVLGDQSSVQVISLSKEELSGSFGHEGMVQGVSFSPDGTHLAVGLMPNGEKVGPFHPLRVWDFVKRRVVFDVYESTVGVHALAYSPDGRLIATADVDNVVRLWTASTGRLFRILPQHPQPVKCLSFSPIGSVLATGSDDKKIRFFDPMTGQELMTQTAPHPKTVQKQGGVSAIAFSLDGQFFVSAYADETISIYEARRLHAMERTSAIPSEPTPVPLSVAKFDQSQFVGVWYSSRAKQIIKMNADGTWKADTYVGNWRLENDRLLWIYSINGFERPVEHNRIISVNEHTFVLEELNGNKTTFSKK